MPLSEVGAALRLPARVNRLVGRALHDYAMLGEGDRVLVRYRDTDVGQFWIDVYDVGML